MNNQWSSAAVIYRAEHNRVPRRVETDADRLGPVPTVRPPRPAPPRPTPPGRLPRRARPGARVAWLRAAVCAAVVMLALLAAVGMRAGAEGPEPPAVTYVVAASDTLWSIAADHAAAGSDLRWLVTGIREANGMTDSNLRAGRRIVIPTGAGSG